MDSLVKGKGQLCLEYSRCVQPYLACSTCNTVGCVVSIWSMFVFLTMLTLYPDGRLTGFALDTKTSGAAKAIKFEEKPSCVEMGV